MDSTQELHERVEALNISDWRVRAIVHLMVDMGRVTAIECQHDDCKLDDRKILPRTGGRGNREPYKLHIDHIVPRSRGGSDRPENLRISHSFCNISLAPRDMTPERRANHSAARERFLESGDKDKWLESMKNREPGWNRKQPPDDRRSGKPASG